MKSTILSQILVVGLVCGGAHAHIYGFSSGMRGEAVVPPNDSTARGQIRLAYNHHTFRYDLDVHVMGIALEDLLDTGPNGTPLHIYNAPRGQTGDIVLDPSYFGDFVQDGDNIRLTVELLRIGGDQGAFESSIFANQEALYDGKLYVQLYTTQYPNGEIRGQIPRLGSFPGIAGSGVFAGLDGEPYQIPAPSASALLIMAGLFASRRQRRTV